MACSLADKPFRVLLDVTELHNNNFKYVWLNICPLKLKTISDFKKSVREKLNLGDKDIKLFVREGLLLDQETIIILRENDTVKVQYEELNSFVAQNVTKEPKNSLKKRNYSECANDVVMDPKKCKIDNISNEINDFVDKKKKYKKSHNSLSTGNIISHAESLEESTHTVAERCDKKAKHEIKMTENYVDSFNINQTLENSGNNTNSDSITFEKNNSDVVIEKHKKKDKKKSDALEKSTDDGNTNNDTFLSFVNVDPTVTQLENVSSSAMTVDPDTFTYDLSKSLQNSDDISKVDVKISVETSKNNQKKKRKRHRKRKNTVSADMDVCQSLDQFVSFTNDVEEFKEQKLDFVAPNVFQNPDAISKSISFSSNEENVKRTHIVYSPVLCEAENNPVEIGNNTKEIHNSSNNICAVNEDVNAQSFKNYPSVSTPNQPNKCKSLRWDVSLMQSTDSVTNNGPQISAKENITNIAEKQSFMKRNCSKQEKISNIKLEDLPPLNSFPEIGTHIKYKVLELDGSYSPVVSEYREGLVKRVNHDTQELKIELFKEVVKPGRTGKFENLKEDENPSPEIIKLDTVQWSSLISPKRM